MDAEQCIDLLVAQVRAGRAQHDLGAAAQPGLYVADRGLQRPPVVVEPGAVGQRVDIRIQQSGDQAEQLADLTVAVLVGLGLRPVHTGTCEFNSIFEHNCQAEN